MSEIDETPREDEQQPQSAAAATPRAKRTATKKRPKRKQRAPRPREAEEFEAPEPLDDEERAARIAHLRAELARLAADEPVEVQGFESLPPGSIIDKGLPTERKKPWTWDDVKQRFPVEDIWSPVTMTVIWNGLKLEVKAMERARIPLPFFKIYQEQLEYQKKFDYVWGPLRPEEKQTFAGFVSRPHLMSSPTDKQGGLDPRPAAAAGR